MFRNLICLTGAVLLLTGCSMQIAEEPGWQQELSHLTQYISMTETPSVSGNQDEPELTETEEILAVWIPVMHYGDWMTGKTEVQFREKIAEVFDTIVELGLNTVFLHVRAYGDAYYPSELFPSGAYLTGEYDPLAIMLEEAHNRGLSAHAWINPLRIQSAEMLARTDTKYPLRQWHDDPEKNGTWLVNVNDRFWLNPAYPEVRQLVADGVTEILENYDVDGIHIDDYFYPTQDAAFDEAAFSESGAADLAAWRRENCTAMVKLLYDTVKAYDKVFSVSPQGNLQKDYDELYADAAKWSSETGYTDWIVPQIYYGFENSVQPFAETLAHWEELASATKLVVGLAPYKIGLEDTWAGEGKNEWQTDGEVLSKEFDLVQNSENADGVAFYSYNALFAPEAAVAEQVNAERERIKEKLS